MSSHAHDPFHSTRNQRRARRLVTIGLPAIAIASVLAPEAASAAATDTFEVRVRAFCEDPGDVCGFTSEEAFRKAYLDAFADVNMIWRPTGVSFHPTFEFDYDRDDLLDGLSTPETLALKAEAAAHPGRITLNVIPTLGGGFSAVPGPGVPPPVPNDYNGLFACCASGTLLAHELGHHFCLAHPFMHLDPADARGGIVSHDGDGLSDTPPDPDGPEWARVSDPQQKKDKADMVVADGLKWTFNYAPQYINDGHEWCDLVPEANDPGSPMHQSCTPQCKLQQNGTTLMTTHEPATQLVMSYYKGVCSGPWVKEGERIEAFSDQQSQRIAECRSLVPERQSLVDLCEDAGGDSDHDGFCDAWDNCPHVADPFNADTDHDGIGDACEHCPDGDDTSDTDMDGVGDSCDFDDDNDGCLDAVDQDPASNQTRIGTITYPGCGLPDKPKYGFAGHDSDGDGMLDCSDPDDDNDGIPDESDDCLDTSAECVTILACPPPPATCTGPGCDLVLDLVMVSVVNPEWLIDFDRWQVDEDGAIWIGPQHGFTVSETAMALLGQAFGPEFEGGRVRLELRRGVEIQQVIAEYDVGEVRLGGITHGTAVQLLASGDGSADVSAVWGAGLGADDVPVDADGDGIPDSADLCTFVFDEQQVDSDGDGYGNACDGDLDQDGVVTEDDVRAVEGCLGMHVSIEPQYGDEEAVGRTPSDILEESLALARCRAADLDGNGVVDARDLDNARAQLGDPPGPSATDRHDADRDHGSPPDGVVEPDEGSGSSDGGSSDDGSSDGIDATVIDGEPAGCGCRSGGGDAVPLGMLLLAAGPALRRRRHR